VWCRADAVAGCSGVGVGLGRAVYYVEVLVHLDVNFINLHLCSPRFPRLRVT
jgi:hypothetical protein